MAEELACLKCEPIGFIRTEMRVKFDAPHQPTDGATEQNVIELLPGRGFDRAVQDLATFDRIWLVWWFHKNSNWKPRVLPPRGGSQKRGVFATRSPHRPNAIGLTAVQLVKIEGLKLYVGNSDLVDGTPILDIKPYIVTVDSFPNASLGWIKEIENELAAPPKYQLQYSPLAQAQLDWLKTHYHIDFMERAAQILSRDPSAHRTRRISLRKNGELRMGCGPWRIFFSLEETSVQILRAAPGYPEESLFREGYDRIPDRQAQVAFLKKWPAHS